ncbi:hypothetical protein [Cypionkella sp. TWP1-2-1b2]
MPAEISDEYVRRVRERADVPRVRSSEVRKIIEAMVALSIETSTTVAVS